MTSPADDPMSPAGAAQVAPSEAAPTLSLNALSGALADAMARHAARLRIEVMRGAGGETLIDCGARAIGGFEAGLRMAEVCLGGLGAVGLVPDDVSSRWPWRVMVR